MIAKVVRELSASPGAMDAIKSTTAQRREQKERVRVDILLEQLQGPEAPPTPTDEIIVVNRWFGSESNWPPTRVEHPLTLSQSDIKEMPQDRRYCYALQMAASEYYDLQFNSKERMSKTRGSASSHTTQTLKHARCMCLSRRLPLIRLGCYAPQPRTSRVRPSSRGTLVTKRDRYFLR